MLHLSNYLPIRFLFLFPFWSLSSALVSFAFGALYFLALYVLFLIWLIVESSPTLSSSFVCHTCSCQLAHFFVLLSLFLFILLLEAMTLLKGFFVWDCRELSRDANVCSFVILVIACWFVIDMALV